MQCWWEGLQYKHLWPICVATYLTCMSAAAPLQHRCSNRTKQSGRRGSGGRPRIEEVATETLLHWTDSSRTHLVRFYRLHFDPTATQIGSLDRFASQHSRLSWKWCMRQMESCFEKCWLPWSWDFRLRDSSDSTKVNPPGFGGVLPDVTTMTQVMLWLRGCWRITGMFDFAAAVVSGKAKLLELSFTFGHGLMGTVLCNRCLGNPFNRFQHCMLGLSLIWSALERPIIVLATTFWQSETKNLQSLPPPCVRCRA